jgi:hypothetical protein
LLSSLSGQPDVHAAATLTEGALLSGTPRKDRSAGARGGLLRQIGAFGILLVKDFGSVLSMQRDARASVLAALREIFDGEWTRHVGTDGGQTLAWKGKLGLIAASTPVVDAHHAVIGAMGERFVTYRLPLADADQQGARALAHEGQERAMREQLAQATSDVLENVSDEEDVAGEVGLTDRLVKLASLVVRCRSSVERHAYSREIEFVPDAELPGRIALVLARIYHALRRLSVDPETSWHLIVKVGLDSMPAIRRATIEALLRGNAATTQVVAGRMGLPSTTVRRALEDLAAHGVVNRTGQGRGRPDLWCVSEWALTRWPSVNPEKSDDLYLPPPPLPTYFSGKVLSNGHAERLDEPDWQTIFSAGGPEPDEAGEL